MHILASTRLDSRFALRFPASVAAEIAADGARDGLGELHLVLGIAEQLLFARIRDEGELGERRRHARVLDDIEVRRLDAAVEEAAGLLELLIDQGRDALAPRRARVVIRLHAVRGRIREGVAVDRDEELRTRRVLADVDARLKLLAIRCVRAVNVDVLVARHRDARARVLEDGLQVLRDGERHGGFRHTCRADSTCVAAAVARVDDDRVAADARDARGAPRAARREDVDDEAVRLLGLAVRRLCVHGVAAVDDRVLAVDANLRVARLELTDVQVLGVLGEQRVVRLELARLRVREVDDELLLEVGARRDIVRHIVPVHADLDAQGLATVDLRLIRLEVIESVHRFAPCRLTILRQDGRRTGEQHQEHGSSTAYLAEQKEFLLLHSHLDPSIVFNRP